MKKVVGILGGLILLGGVCLGGVVTDKIVFGDDTEMTTAPTAGGGGTNTLAEVLSAGNDANALVITNATRIKGVEPATPGSEYYIDLVNGEIGWVNSGSDYECLEFGNPASGTGGRIWDSVNQTKVLEWHSSNGHILYDSGGDEAFDTETGELSGQWGVAIDMNSFYLFDQNSDDILHWNEGGVRINGAGTADKALKLNMDDAAGADCTEFEWVINGQDDANGNWRMKVINSNLVVQVRVDGTWTNATQFARP